MAGLNTGLLSLYDQAERTDPNGNIPRIVEALTRRNTVLEDMVSVEGNLATGHRFTSRTGLPSIGWRRLNEGVALGKSQTSQIDESCGLLAGMSAVDVEVAKLNGNGAAFRASEDTAFLQSFNNEVSTGIFYHSTKTAPEKFMGLTPRLDATAGNPFAGQILKAGGAANLTSIWLVAWSEDTVFTIFPKAQKAGLEHRDLGEQLWDDGTGKKFTAYVSDWKWRIGLCVKDARYLVRICNIDTGTLTSDASAGAKLIELMVKAYHQMYDSTTGKRAWYVNRVIGTFLHLQAMNAVKNSTLTIEMIGGRPIVHFLGIPVRETDALVNSETTVV